jgi:hypothetical protein
MFATIDPAVLLKGGHKVAHQQKEAKSFRKEMNVGDEE